jgi:hypothetical protein
MGEAVKRMAAGVKRTVREITYSTPAQRCRVRARTHHRAI